MVHSNEPTKPCAWYSIVFPGLHAPKIPKIHIWLVTKVIPQKHRCHQIDSDRFPHLQKRVEETWCFYIKSEKYLRFLQVHKKNPHPYLEDDFETPNTQDMYTHNNSCFKYDYSKFGLKKYPMVI